MKKTRTRRGKSEGGIYQRKDGTWCASASLGYCSRTGKRLRKCFYGDSKAEAMRKLADFKAGWNSAVHEVPSSSAEFRGTFADYAEKWLSSRRLFCAGTTCDIDEYFLRHKLNPHVGHLLLTAITRDDVRKLYAVLSENKQEKMVPTSVKKAGILLGQVLDAAVEEGILSTNASRGVPKPAGKHGEQRHLSLEEMQIFLEASRRTLPAWHVFFVLMIDTGMRPGEIRALRWQDVDLEAGSLQVRRAISCSRQHGIHIKEPKTAASKRQILLSQETVRLLQERYHATAEEIRSPDRLIFPSKTGTLQYRGNFYKTVFRKVLIASGLPSFPLYALRHTSATLLLLLGENPKIVSERLGHASIHTTLDVYSHVIPTMQKEAATKMSKLFATISSTGGKLGGNEE